MINKNLINEARTIIGAELRNLRQKKGLSQTQVAELVGLTTNTISKVEIGKFDFGIDILFKLSIIYAFTINLAWKENGDANRFLLQIGKEQDTYIVTDSDNHIVCFFKKGQYNSTQKFTFLEDIVPINLATILRELGDWLALNHADII